MVRCTNTPLLGTYDYILEGSCLWRQLGVWNRAYIVVYVVFVGVRSLAVLVHVCVVYLICRN